MASIAVIMPIKAIIPKAIIATVMLVLSLLLLTVRQAKLKESSVVMQYKLIRQYLKGN
jgi:glycerol-3-phosphate O-acyltransferase